MAKIGQGHHIPVKARRVAAVIAGFFNKKPDSMMAEARGCAGLGAVPPLHRQITYPRATVIDAEPASSGALPPSEFQFRPMNNSGRGPVGMTNGEARWLSRLLWNRDREVRDG
ncbi:hypothetical protein [Bosea sp. (in: a-proteobacteria)]|uniref:hypothetical protein n=1 Tax=Bosea sp. (in: a-proteobacteria) TaxID=1871050 RepID=UPI002FCB5F59